MIGSDLEGADLESRAAGWAASVISDDAAAVRTVIEAYGDRATSQATITIRAVGETLPARLRQLFVLERTGVTGRSRSTCASRCRSSQEGAAPASGDFPTRIRARSASARGRRARRGSGYADVYLPVQGPCRQTSRSRSRPCGSWGAGAAAGHGSRPPMH
jgi:hypothetical protein